MLFTSEQVSCGHPDKICDQISDALLDAYLAQDCNSRVGIETLIKNNTIVVAGEVASASHIYMDEIIKDTLKDVGLDRFSPHIINLISVQSPDISIGVDGGGAGDQGIIYGYACNETKSMLPLSYVLATEALQSIRNLKHPLLGIDAKAQVTIQDDGKSSREISTFLISTQHSSEIDVDDVRKIIIPVMHSVADKHNVDSNFNVLVNPTGRFVVGGSYADAGVTGRKIIADTYGGYARHGGGAFSGKDPSKVDRSAAYMARYVAKNLLHRFGLQECEIQLGYAIGVAEPVSVNVSANALYSDKLSSYVSEQYDLTPNGIIEALQLKRPIYYQTARYGHFTNQSLPWEVIIE